MHDSLRAAIGASFQEAAADLGLRLTAPFTLVDPSDGAAYEVLALLHDFGTPRGTLILAAGDRTPVPPPSARAGYFFSKLEPVYARYDRQLWLDTLEDWCWTGVGDPPAWYTGQSPWE